MSESAKAKEEIALCPCPSCEATGRIYNNNDRDSGQWLPCDYCAATGLVSFAKLTAYYDKLQEASS